MPDRYRLSSWGFLAAVLVLAALLRFWQLETLPPGLYHDEAYNGLDALSLLQGKTFPQFYEGWELYPAEAHAVRGPLQTRFPIFFEGNYGREPLHVYLMALSVALFGATPFALRAVPAAAGVLAVFTTFLAAEALLRALLGERAAARLALLAAFLLAILYPALHFSRFGIRAMLFVPVQTMAVACFWWAVNRAELAEAGLDRRSWLLFLGAGFFTGLGLYTFAAARLFPLVWLLFVPLWFWLDSRARHLFWQPILGMAAAAFLTALPLLIFFARYPYYFVFRIAYVANKGKGAVEGKPWLTWLLNTGRVARGFLWLGETHLRHNLPGRPFFDPIQALFFLAGLARALWHLKRPRALFLLIWFGVMLLPSILSGDAPHFGRLAGSYAPAAILAALGAGALWRLLRVTAGRFLPPDRAQTVATGTLALLLAFSGLLTFRDYFSRYAAHPDLAGDFYLDDWHLGRYAAAFRPNTRLFLSPAQEELATIYFALADPQRLRDFDGALGTLPAGTPGLDSLYMLRSGELAATVTLQSFFPHAERAAIGDAAQAYLVSAAAERVQAQHQVNAPFGSEISLLGWSSELQGQDLLVTLFWLAEAEMDRNYTAYVHLTDGDGQLLAQLDQEPPGYPTADWLPGEVIVSYFAVPLPADFDLQAAGLSTGFYHLPDSAPLGEAAVLAAPGELVP